jgi:signal transduction histidine kinase
MTAILLNSYVAIGMMMLAAACIIVMAWVIWKQRRIIQFGKSKTFAEIKTLENGRYRMAADLHDEIGPILAAIKLLIASIEFSPEDQKGIEKALRFTDDIIRRVREISNDLRPGTLMRTGLTSAVREFIDNISSSINVQINFVYSNVPDLPVDISLNVYRIILEIIHNTLKHAKASALHIELVTANQKLVLQTADNGIGFDYQKMKTKSSGLGLLNLLNRTEVMNGEMTVDSRLGHGTRYTIKIPLQKN